MKPKIAVLINYRDRPTELALLLQSLRTQTYKNFRIYILDDFSGMPIETYHFLVCIINKLNEEGNFIKYEKTPFHYGVSKARHKCVAMAQEDGWADLFLRVDDDVILEPDYIEKLLEVISKGYDLATGVTPFIGQPQFKRESRFIQPIANRMVLDKEGNLIYNGDDFGTQYLDDAIIPIHHFRSCALYKKEIHEKIPGIYLNNLTKHGFREEQIFSIHCILNGFKLAVRTGAIAWHLLTPSGGERWQHAEEDIKMNEEILRNFIKKQFKQHGDFIEKYNKKLGINIENPDHDEFLKPTNLIIK